MASTTFRIVSAGCSSSGSPPTADLSLYDGYFAPGYVGSPDIYPNVLNMTSTSFDVIVVNNVSSVSASPGSGSWVFSPNPTTGIFQDVLSVNPTVKTAIVYFGTTSEPSGPGESHLFFFTGSEGVLDMFCSDDATINCPSTGPTEWTVSSRSGVAYLTIVRTGTDTVSTGLLWIVVELSAPNYIDIYQQDAGVPGKTFGMQGVGISYTADPPPACFGKGTLVLCGDGTKRDVSDLRGRVTLLALPPLDALDDLLDLPVLPVKVEVQVYCRKKSPEQVFEVAPSVFVTKDHTVCLKGRPVPPHLAKLTDWHCMGGRFKGCSWIAKALPEFAPVWTTSGVYHFVPTDPIHRQYGLLVGSDCDDTCACTCVAEMFRSSPAMLTRHLGFAAHDS